MYNLMRTCEDLGTPVATKKLEGPSTTLTILGVVIDTAAIKIRLPDDKLQCICQELVTWMGKDKSTKCHILSLVGLLQYATKLVKCVRNFVDCRSQSERTRLLHMVECGISIRFNVVAHIY